jgi:hypothetical protein
MNDVERRIQRVLDEDAREAPRVAHAPADLRRRVRRRQSGTAILAGLTVVALLIVSVSGIGLLARSLTKSEPGGMKPPDRTTTIEGVTITYPGNWYLSPLDRSTTTESQPADGGPPFAFRPLLQLTNFDPGVGRSWFCPLPSGSIPDDGVVLYVQAVDRTIDAGEPGTWPAEPSSDVLAGSAEGPCPLGSHTAAWTADGVTYEAFLSGSGADYDRLLGSFLSMTFSGGTPAVAGPIKNELEWTNEGGSLVATGTFSGVDWKVATAAAGITVTISGSPDRETVVGWPSLGWSLTRRLHVDRPFDAVALVLTDLDVTRVCAKSEGEWCGRWMPARDAGGAEARLWIIELPGAGSGSLVLNDKEAGSITWP